MSATSTKTRKYFCDLCDKEKIYGHKKIKVKETINNFCKTNNYKLISEYTKSDDKHIWCCTKCNLNIVLTWDYLKQLNRSHNCKKP